MVKIDRVRQLAKVKGLKVSALCSQIGMYRTYLSDVERGKSTMPEERIELIADILDTTVEYLKGITDKKEKPATLTGDGLDEEILQLFRRVPPDKVQEAERYLRFLVAEQENSDK